MGRFSGLGLCPGATALIRPAGLVALPGVDPGRDPRTVILYIIVLFAV